MIKELVDLKEGDVFLCPWRPEGRNVGELLHTGRGSCSVRVPRHDGDGWESTHWAPGTQVVPTEREQLLTQMSLDDSGGVIRERSRTESPVATVHRICSEMKGATRDAIIEECVKQGVNKNTAKTQYYAWRKKRKG